MSQDLQRDLFAVGNSLRASELYEFGPITIDPARHRVARDGQTLALPPKTYELLLLLVRSGGRALSRHELMSALWPDTFVEEANLTFQVSTLRKALGESADAWIETVPRVGYRFTPAVTTQASEPELPNQASAGPGDLVADSRLSTQVGESRQASGGRSRTRFLIALLALVAVTLVAIGWRAARRTNADPGVRLGQSAMPFTSYVGTEGAPSFSPDGSQVAFHWNGRGQDNMDLYVKSLGGGEPIRLTADPAFEAAPAWSPDGHRLAFLKQQPGHLPDVMIMPALGGTARRVATLRVLTPTADYTYSVGYLSWSPDGRWLAIGAIMDGQRGIWLLEVDGSRRRRLTSNDMSEWGPAFSADGRYLAFIRASDVSQSALMILPLANDLQPSGAPVTVVAARSRQVVSAAWAPGDRALVYAVGSHMSSSRLWRLSFAPEHGMATGEPEPMLAGEQATGLDIAQSGRLVYAAKFRDSGLWRLDLQQPGKGFGSADLPTSTFDEHTPEYAPDGQRLAFASTRTGTEEIWISDLDGSNARQMTNMGGPLCANPRWSPDGRYIAFDAIKDGQRDLYLVDVQTAEVRPVTSGVDREQTPRWSRDGEWLYFGLFRPPDFEEVHRMRATGGASERLAEGGTGGPSQDDRWLFVSKVTKGRPGIWRVALPNGVPEQVADEHLDFVVGRRHLYFVARRPTGLAVESIAIDSRHRQTLATLDRRPWWGIAVSPDERWLLVSAINSQGADLMVVEPGS